MKGWTFLIVAAGLLLSGGAGATVVKNGDGKTTGAASGGVDVTGTNERVRVQCWQDGRKIIDEAGLAAVSLSIANQMNALRFRRTGDPTDPALSVMTQARTTCLLSPQAPQ